MLHQIERPPARGEIRGSRHERRHRRSSGRQCDWSPAGDTARRAGGRRGKAAAGASAQWWAEALFQDGTGRDPQLYRRCTAWREERHPLWLGDQQGALPVGMRAVVARRERRLPRQLAEGTVIPVDRFDHPLLARMQRCILRQAHGHLIDARVRHCRFCRGRAEAEQDQHVNDVAPAGTASERHEERSWLTRSGRQPKVHMNNLSCVE